MWSRKELKTRAKAVLRISYWKAFLVSLVIAFAGGNSVGSFNFKFPLGGSGNSQNFSGGSPESFVEMLPFILIFLGVIFLTICLVFAFRVLKCNKSRVIFGLASECP